MALDATTSALLETIRDAYFSIDREWRLTYVNRAAEQFWDRPRSEVLGRHLLEVFPQLAGSTPHLRFDQALATGERAQFEAVSVVTGTPIELDVHPGPEGLAVFVRDVRDRWRLREELSQRDVQLRMAEQSAGIGIWDIDVASDTVRGTAQFFRTMGLEPTADPVPMGTLRALRFPEDRERVNDGYREAVESGRDVYDSEFRIRRGDGEVRWIFGRGRVVRDAAGNPVRYSGVDFDVTDRRVAELALAESEDRLKMAVEASNLGIWDWDVLTNEMRWNEKAKAIFGLPIDQPLSFEQVRATTHPDDLPRTSQMARRALDPLVKSREAYEYRALRPDRAIRWVLAHGEARFAIVDGVEKAVRYTGTIQDITERKEQEQRLERSEARLRLAVEAARLAIWGYDIAAERLENTPELNRILGFPDDQPIDVAEIRKRYLPGEEERIRRAGEQALASGERYFQTEYRYERPDQQVRWLLLRAEIFLNALGVPAAVVGVIMDITDQKAAEEQRELVLAELQHRIKNTLALVSAMATQTFRDRAGPALESFSSRIAALGRAHDALSETSWQSANLRDVVERAITPYRTGEGRFGVAGPGVRLSPREALALSLAINELATNAAKYGALANADGRISIAWSIETESGAKVLYFRWAESGGPPVVAPSRAGFGSRLIQQNLSAEFGGEVNLDYAPTGIVCTLSAPRR